MADISFMEVFSATHFKDEGECCAQKLQMQIRIWCQLQVHIKSWACPMGTEL